MPSRRRQVVLAVLVAALVAAAGCSGILGSTETELLLVNNDEQSHDVTVEVLDDGDVVYSEQETVDENTNNDFPTFEGSGEYTVAVTVDGATTESVHEFSEDPETLSIGVQNDASVIIGG
ncbi:hypothetical protein [Halobacterium bonnevillei]|uniref:Ig-like domain-containing protein n=1 Tax=Halobacterium bonnevillei TaxID=2692200 RepID=A0A6B0SNX6_9EURY|nr:hypothetical protein [Halobacterium bonnevillei]MXR19329.1 hypothetical protein [Halobacterium bonnevillei]